MDVTEKHPSKFFELTALNLRGSGSGLVWLTNLLSGFFGKLRVFAFDFQALRYSSQRLLC